MASAVLNTVVLPPDPEQGNRRFAAALVAGVILEVALIGALVWYGETHQTKVVPPPKKHVIAVQMVTLPPPPKVVPKPVVKPTPPKPMPPKPVIHHSPPPPPTPHPKMVVPPKPVPTPPAPPVKVAPPPPKPVPVPKPVTPPPPPAPPPMSAAEKADLMGQYVAELRPIIQNQLHVPAELRAMGLSGTATVEFEVSPSGQVLWAKVIKPSPLGPVNRAAVAAVKSGNFPAFLQKMPKQNTVFEIPIEVGAGSSS
ncbi:TonB family protein [Acidithiobacillus sp. CV18-2]|uniref:TonB family protein n=1 Tax=Igneacidithiobacillus copahuensis TaxID=2724909 RepID=A0AAE2YQG9_9PROT|nr:energy transducer TonB [Igneacidithiobacillus copahuensis]MBU2753139.1 TonB family protein [Acidithiobacillus sp. CV18-3]MBU2756713.1 TonB family protein [Acidithiobacillus sp. BN09-2]MBU2776598.1 TonB family protein [Acidithiobacillus sp. CV18-2]MBU2796971.1 TonB family protein [Acidithiobacillus sp. VAN18-2]MBU2798199.1 TonB family protein [Acidithiobacillus sp. VAN18-4]UTV80454.1 energy transducer TonB [Acidithiobacillus sp. YTS05]